MPKLPSFTPKKLLVRFKKMGFIQDHTTGSHVILFHPRTGRRAVVPMHISDIKKGTLLAILRESQISRDELLSA